jgi:hypothetical protein
MFHFRFLSGVPLGTVSRCDDLCDVVLSASNPNSMMGRMSFVGSVMYGSVGRTGKWKAFENGIAKFPRSVK